MPFHLLEEVPELSFGDKDSGNLLVQGDNLTALKALLPYYAGKVKCIYIDPPYNTGNESWVYNDNSNDPQIKEWLGKTVGKEAEDLSRHDKWLCMMYPRLRILRDLLSEDGTIWISIDDNEVATLRLLLDEILGNNNLVAILPWIKRVSPANDAKFFSSDHEYIVVWAKNKPSWAPRRLTRTIEQLDNYRNPDNDPRGVWNSVTYTCNKNLTERPNLYYAIENPNTHEIIYPEKTAVWKYNEETHFENVKNKLLYWGVSGTAKKPRLKRFLNDMGDVVPRSFLKYEDCGHTQEAKNEMKKIGAGDFLFDTPKPERLVRRILQLATKDGDIVLDSFLGSGTTCAVAHKMSRQYIGIEMGEHCETLCASRLKKVIEGEQGGISKEQNWKGGGGFRYYRLGKPLFDESGKVFKGITFSKLARHVFFTETGHPLEKEHCDSALIGIYNNTAVYLLFNGILKDKKPDSGNVLTGKILALLPEHDGPKVIYGTACRLSPVKLRAANIVFKQVPYEIKAD
ncbi:MAG: site-specific DNA-methyltransferase [Lentisphaerota bacterium]